MNALPTGTVTFLFTDIQGSTKLWQSYPHQMKKALVRHDEILKKAIEENNGFVFKTVGDAFCATFDTAMEGVKAALSAQLAVYAGTWETPIPILVRMALHTGEALERDQDYYGPALSRVARLEAIGHGGQTLVSLVTAELVRDMLPEGVELKDLGERRLKDLTRPESVFQLRHPDLPDDFPSLKSLDMHPHNLPMQSTPLIGREKELESVGKMLDDPAVRIVTLTGPGGMGKTRLGLQLAADLIGHFEDGAFFIDLAPVSDPELMISVLARTLHVKETGNRKFLDIVKGYLCGKKMLLLLDNFEQIMDAALQVVELLGFCPGVKFLVTSREALHLRGEKVFAVPSLTLPELETKDIMDVEAITQYEAVRLFIDRAAALRQGFQVNNENAPAVAEICVRLDGIPLAIELAAARVRLLSPHAILNRLDNRLKLLTGGARDLPDRQKTLRATINWSYELLEERCRELFRTLSVFVGGFTLEVAEAVYAGEPFADGGILDGVESLIDKSLVCLEEHSAGASVEIEPRFHMLETIRELGLEKLKDSGDEELSRKRHAEYFLELAERAEPELARKEQEYWLHLLDIEHENIRAAFAWFNQQEKWEGALRLSGSLWEFWQIRGLLSEGSLWLKRAISNSADVEAKYLAKAFLGVGCLDENKGLYDEAKKMVHTSLELFRRVDNQSGVAKAYHELGFICLSSDLFDEAATHFANGNNVADRIGDEVLSARTLIGLGLLNWKEGSLDTAKEQFENSRSVFVKCGDIKRESGALSNLGILYYQEGDFQKAKDNFQQAIEIQRKIGDFDNMRSVLNNLGYLNFRLGDYGKSESYYRELVELFKDSDDKRIRATAFAGLADVYLSTGETERAFDCAQKAYGEIEDLESGVELAVSLRVLGDVHLENNDAEQAKIYFERSMPLLEKAKETEDLLRAKEGYDRSISILKGG